MAKLFINKDIAADADKLQYWLSGDDCVSYTDIQAFLDYYKDDPRIDVELHSCGGSCIEGYAIYDALRVSGKEISCTVVGTCASMATVILLAAPKERRTMYPNARLLIHNPHFQSLTGEMTIGKMEDALKELRAEKERMMAIYEERTGATREELESQMETDAWFGSDRAIELGFVSSVVPLASAKHSEPSINEKKNVMKGQKPSVAEAFKMLGAALGLTKGDGEAVAKTITTSTGEELTVERDEGEIQVGDKASPDGNHVLEDGTTVVVEGGVITEIREASQEEENAEAKEADRGNEMEALQNENSELKAKVEALQKELDESKAKAESERNELEAQAKSDEEKRILDAVAKAGGEAWLAKTAASTYVPDGRANTEQGEGKRMSLVEKRLAEARERQKNRFKKH